jgi:hypothetical protein
VIDGKDVVLLSATEIAELTGRDRPGWQARELDHLGIPYRRRSDGSLVVLRIHVEGTQDIPRRQPQVRLDA